MVGFDGTVKWRDGGQHGTDEGSERGREDD
jgi:hypothetical protein